MFRVILEGPDNAGKTSLAEALLDGQLYFHPGGPPNGYDAEDRCIAEQVGILSNNDFILMDRCTPISQMVYDPAQGRIGIRMAALGDMLMMGTMIVYCRPSTDMLMSFEDFTWRAGETEEHKQKIIRDQHTFIQRYDDLMLRVPHIAYDYKSDDAEAVRDLLRKCLAGNQESMNFVRSLSPFNFRAVCK